MLLDQQLTQSTHPELRTWKRGQHHRGVMFEAPSPAADPDVCQGHLHKARLSMALISHEFSVMPLFFKIKRLGLF